MLLPVLILALLLLLPTAAHADSIVYTKGHDVWVAQPDGSSARQVTSGGGYQSATQANDGTILAQQGTRFVRLDRSGRVLSSIDSVLTGKPAGIRAVGPFDPVISPDGTKVAYWIGMYSSWMDYRHHIEWTRTGPVTIWQDARDGRMLGFTHYYDEPSWLPGGEGALLFAEENALTAQVVASGIGEDHTKVRQWFRDSENKPAGEEYPKAISSGELSPGLDRLALLRATIEYGSGGVAEGPGNTIVTYGVSLPGVPTMECRMTGAVGGEFGKPSWSPDGTSLAWQEGNGIWTMPIGRDCSGSARLVIPDGAGPDWGPAEPGGGAGPGPRRPSVRVPRSVGRHAALRIAVTCSGACKASAVARAGRRVVARTSKRISGSSRLTLRPKRVGGARRLAVSVTVRPDGGAATTVSRRVRLR
jgi:WD40-like Beta Propeller Repeat